MQTRRGLGLVLACAGAIVSTHLHPSPPVPAISISHQPSASPSASARPVLRFPGTFLVLGLAGAVAIFILFFSLFSLSLFPRFLRISRATTSRHGYVGRGFHLLLCMVRDECPCTYLQNLHTNWCVLSIATQGPELAWTYARGGRAQPS